MTLFTISWSQASPMWHKSHCPHFTDEETEAHEKLNNLTEATHLRMAEPRLYYSFNSFLVSFKNFFPALRSVGDLRSPTRD